METAIIMTIQDWFVSFDLMDHCGSRISGHRSLRTHYPRQWTVIGISFTLQKSLWLRVTVRSTLQPGPVNITRIYILTHTYTSHARVKPDRCVYITFEKWPLPPDDLVSAYD